MSPIEFTQWFLCTLACVVGGITLFGLLAKSITWTLEQIYSLDIAVSDLIRYCKIGRG